MCATSVLTCAPVLTEASVLTEDPVQAGDPVLLLNNRILEFILLLLLQEILPDNDVGALAESRSGRSLDLSRGSHNIQ